MNQFNRATLALVLCLFGTSACFGQASSGGGNIQGTVKDSSGAAIPAAKITISDIDTGELTRSVANASGYFTTPPIRIGKYRIRVEAEGMKAWESQVTLETGAILEVDPVLTPGQITETIQVTETLPLVTTTDPTEASTLDAKRIKELPINGRNLNSLLEDVTPGVEQVIDVNGGVRTGGLMVYSTEFVQDGAPSNNREFGGSMNLAGLDSIGEVRVETSTSSAKYQSPTSVIVTTKSGTNQIHGSLFETARNNSIGVARARQDINLNGSPYRTPKLIRNEFGGSIGGPIFLPSFGINGRKLYNGRSRTFFFIDKEGTELVEGLTKTFSVPTVAMRQGDFSGLQDSLGRNIILYDPATSKQATNTNGTTYTTRTPFVGNIIPQSRQSSLSKRIWAITPLPTDITNPIVTANYQAAVPTNGLPNLSDDPTAIKLDHRLNDTNNVFLKVNGGHRHTNFQGTGTSPLTGAPTLDGAANVTYLPMDAITAAFSFTHVFTPTLFVETNINNTWQATQTITGAVQKNWSSDFGLPNPYGDIGFPNITSVQFMNYVEGDNRRGLHSNIFNLQQNYTWVKGKHNLQFGGGAHREKQNLLPDEGVISGSAAFNSLGTALMSSTSGSNPTAVSLTGNDAANFYLGDAASYTVTLKRGVMHLTEKDYNLYAQDSWRVGNRLTIFSGLRWDMNPGFRENNYQLNSFDVKNHAIMLAQPLDYYYKNGITTPQIVKIYQATGMKFESAADAGLSPNIFPSNWFDIGPRGGFAYRMFDGNKQLVIRGGYGMYISKLPMRTLLSQFSSMPPFRSTFTYAPNSSATSPDGVANWLLRNNQVYTAGVNSVGSIDTTNPNSVGIGSVGVVGLSTDLPDSKVHEWNLTLEKQLSPSLVFRLTYSGKHGSDLDQLNELNPQQTDYNWYSATNAPLPTGAYSAVARRPYDSTAYQSVRILQKTGMLNSQVFTAQIERRFSHGLSFQAFYTLTNTNRLAGNSFRDGVYNPPSNYQPGAVSSDFATANRFENYARDTAVPQHRVRWNSFYEVPVGRGQKFLSKAPKWVDQFVGGWKLSGTGTVVSTWFALPTGNWVLNDKDIQIYGTKYPILDCTQTPTTGTTAADERCIQGYLFYNGYISQKLIESRNAAGLRNGIFGLPANYKPAIQPITPWPVGGKTTDTGAGDYDTDVVYFKLNNGTTQRVTADSGLHPWRNQYRLGPFNWNQDISLGKFFAIHERFRIGANVDLFNAFNTQGLNTPGSNGIVTLQNSYGGFGIRPRQLQLRARLEW